MGAHRIQKHKNKNQINVYSVTGISRDNNVKYLVITYNECAKSHGINESN